MASPDKLKKTVKALEERQKRQLKLQEKRVKYASEHWRKGPGLLTWLLILALIGLVIYYFRTNSSLGDLVSRIFP